MVQYLTPGVYIEEQTATGPISGVGTSVAAFLGVAQRGPVATPSPVTNLTTFSEQFTTPGPTPAAYQDLVMAVRGFFENGGTSAYIVRVGNGARARLVLRDRGEGDTAEPALVVTAREEGEAGNDIVVAVSDGSRASAFTLVVSPPGQPKETFANLDLDAAAIRGIDSKAVEVALPDRVSRRTDDYRLPAATEETRLEGGYDDNPGTLTLEDWERALGEVRKVDNVSLVCAPGIHDTAIQEKIVRHCEQARDRFAILDSAPGATSAAVLVQRRGVGSDRGYAALYYPWLKVADPAGRGRDDLISVPPSGHLAGVYARVDAERGVHKAPANERVSGALGLERLMDDRDQETLNEAGVNALRVLAGQSRPVVWGARTTAPADEATWRYVNVRRLMLFIAESIQDGIRWAVFEPNELGLWRRLDRTITEFLTRVWASGALFGETAEKAFYVKIDEENNPPGIRQLGQVVVEIGVAPVNPAEFVVVRIGIWAGGSEVEEA